MIDRKALALLYGRTEQELRACAAFVKDRWPEETAVRMRIASQVSEHQFIFDLPWDMEQTVNVEVFRDGIDWLRQPEKDVEFIYQMNRHRYWICLGQAYALTGEESYVTAFVSQMMDWIIKNPLAEELKKKTWRRIEAGIRAENWLKAIGYMLNSPQITARVWEAFEKALLLHGQYLSEDGGSFSVRSNWGIMESSGLFAIGKVMENSTENNVRQMGQSFSLLAMKRLEKQLLVQVMDDGVHWEQSPMYHNEVLHCCLEVLRLADRCGHPVSEDTKDRIKSMAYADRFWQKPDGTQPAGGDSDCTDMRDILTAAAWQFRDSMLKSGAFSTLDYESAWDYGTAAGTDYEMLEAKEPEEKFICLKDSGNWFLRSGWDRRGDYFHVKCGGLGGGHGHFDKLHIDLIVNGEELLTDSGRYTYVNGEERYRFKYAAAHNTAMAESREYSHCLDAWSVSGLNPAVNGGYKRKGNFTFIQCGHTGYMEQGLFINRKILAAGTKLYVINDEFYSAAPCGYCQHFHLAPQCRTTLLEGECGVLVMGKDFRAKIICLSEGAEAAVERTEISRHYNQTESSETVVFKKNAAENAKGISSMLTVILCWNPAEKECTASSVPVLSPGSGRILETSEADGLLISDQKKKYVAVIAHTDAGGDCEYIGAMGHYGLGRVMISELGPQENGTPEEFKDMTVLWW